MHSSGVASKCRLGSVPNVLKVKNNDTKVMSNGTYEQVQHIKLIIL